MFPYYLICQVNFVLAHFLERRSIREYVSLSKKGVSAKLVGLGGFEPPTSPLSGVHSNQLSYRPFLLMFK